MFLFFGKNIISSPVIKARSDKLHKRVLRDAKKKIKNGELIDSHSFGMYLQVIDAEYAHIKNDINNATQTANYTRIRANKIAETRQLLDFFRHDNSELARLYRIVVQKARDAKRTDDLKEEKLSSVDTSDLKVSFERLTKKEEE